MRLRGLHPDDDQLVGREGGFLGIRRLRLRNVDDTGALGRPYGCDFVVRPTGLDAVVVVAWHRRPDGVVEVLLRDGLRPALVFGRPADEQVLPDPRSYLLLTELVAGIVERGEHGEGGLRARAAAELLEEAGYRVEPGRFRLLGGGVFPSPGALAEKFFFTEVEVLDPALREEPEGDGSPMEEGATIRWCPLDDALAACVAGEVEDCKTELGLRRLRDRLATPGTP